jgi:hypothetical protein
MIQGIRVLRYVAGGMCRLGSVAAVIVGAASLDRLWTPIAIVSALALMIAGSALSPSMADRATGNEQGPTLYARDGKPYGPLVDHQGMPRAGASWTDGV